MERDRERDATRLQMVQVNSIFIGTPFDFLASVFSFFTYINSQTYDAVAKFNSYSIEVIQMKKLRMLLSRSC